MRKHTLFFLIPAALIACSGEQADEIPDDSGRASGYQIDASRATVSGLSSGGYMAGQLHLAHSGLFSGVAILAGGPYWCAEASLTTALGPCIKGGDIAQQRLLAYARGMATTGNIDSLDNLADDSVWVFHAAHDVVVSADVASATAAFYAELVPQGGITLVSDVPAVHGMPTTSFGTSCDTVGTPFLNACNYDAAGELLKTLYGSLHKRTEARGEIRVIPQPGGADAVMLDSAFLYVPESCAAGAECGLHVALHGCQQSAEFVGDAFAAGAGYNEWAESNKLLVLYPQVASSKMTPLNPLGCWDWWGYTNENYATKAGPQIVVIKSMIDALAGATL